MWEVVMFYNGLDFPTRQILDSRGAIPSKTVADAKVAIQEMVEYSQNGTMEHQGLEKFFFFLHLSSSWFPYDLVSDGNDDPNSGCEMVLGIQWLATLGDMQCNFKKLIMKFNHKVQLCQMENVGSVSAEVDQVLTQFDEVFKVPKDLPHQRSHDHQIHFMPNTPSINVRPYKHPPNQKDSIKGMVKMKEDDICKTAFRTHEGHYEFFVMPFGLTNAPLTFQSLMNTVFKALLKKFVLVFFDDILIYNKNLEEHYDHLSQVLQVMKDNTLYAKRTKCYFTIPSTKYLGHIISAQGGSTDPSKIEDMQKWPIPLTLKHLRGFLGLTGYYRRNVLFTQANGITLPMENWYTSPKQMTGGILKRKGKVVVGKDPKLRKELVQHFHEEAIGGHFGTHVTMMKLRSLGCYLRCMYGEKPKEWVKWLPLAKFWYNANYHTSTKTTPYEAVYCQTPSIHVPYTPGDSRVKEVDMTLQTREEAIKVLKFHIKRSQDKMRSQANKHRTDR
nr:retrovirus-related Pol polyprotein from transposon 17.6 [Tanacetum cinerariifolium]